jgi:hypothetical protein
MSFSPDELVQGNYCVYEVSKDLDGLLTLLDADYRVCSGLNCNPLVHQQFLRLDATTNQDCEAPQSPGEALDGLGRVRYFTTVFTGPKESWRGVHACQFDWIPAAGGRIVGTMEGISNAGVLRTRVSPPAARSATNQASRVVISSRRGPVCQVSLRQNSRWRPYTA